ncbi:MAG: class C sortase [Oscillospiraceae bacterium]|nr:class C sortase [Oscillospiraceae bacterium]
MKQSSKKKRSIASWLGSVALVLVLVAGVLIVLYPSVSNWWNNNITTHVVQSYEEEISSLSEEDYSAYLEAAQEFNEMLAEMGSRTAFLSTDELEEYGYYDILNITGTGIMGYVTIETINVELPIYHGTSTSALAAGAGHLEGTSQPVGGENTHCVISAHRGLPSALMFTRLDELEIGDTFTITVLGEVLTYEVDKISIVEPDEMSYLYIEDGKDYCTLMTCTPYGINTHRLLVRGVRIETTETTHIKVTAEAYKIDTVVVAVIVAIPLIIILFIIASLPRKKHIDEQGRDDI